MQDAISSIIVGVGATNNTNQRQILGISASDGVYDAQPADGKGDNARSDAVGTSVAIGSVSGVELVAAADVGEAGFGNEVVKESEVEVAGDGEEVADADLNEATGDVSAKSGVGRGGDGTGGDAGGALGGRGSADEAVGSRFGSVNGSNSGFHGYIIKLIWESIVMESVVC